jgi:hypothetical protein
MTNPAAATRTTTTNAIAEPIIVSPAPGPTYADEVVGWETTSIPKSEAAIRSSTGPPDSLLLKK